MSSSLVLTNVGDKSYYNRSNNNEYIRSKELLMKGYNANECLILPSGMHAIILALEKSIEHLQKTNEPITIVYQKEMYCDTFRTINYLRVKHDLHEYEVPNDDNQSLKMLFRKKLKKRKVILFIESCSNPNSIMFDFSVVKSLRKTTKDLIIVCDNTWLTYELLNPLDYGVDLVVNSLTKYYSAGNCIAGCLLGRKSPIITQAEKYRVIAGLHVSPIHCKYIADNMSSLKMRLKQGNESYEDIMKILNKSDECFRVNKIPYVNNDCKLYPPMINWYMKTNTEEIVERIKKCGIPLETSYGGKYSKKEESV